MTSNHKRPCSACGESVDPKDLIVHISGEQADEYRLLSYVVDQICHRVANHHLHYHEHEEECCLHVVADLLVDIGWIGIGDK